MATGLKVINNDGFFQIDGSTLNFQLINKQTGNTSRTSLKTVYNNVNNQFSVTYNAVSFSFIATSPLVAFRSPDGVRVCIWNMTRVNNTFTVTFITNTPSSVTMWVFDQSQATNDNYGIKVYNESGALVCSGIQPFAKVLDVISGQYVPGSGWYAGGGQMPGNNLQSRSYGYSPAFAAVYPCHYMELTGDGNGGSTVMSGLSISGNTISWEFFTFASTRSGNFVGFIESTAYRFMVLDVTNI